MPRSGARARSGGPCCSTAGAGGRRLLLILHHLVVDGVSWRILLDDLERACAQLERGAPSRSRAPKTTSYQQWASVWWRLRAATQLAAEGRVLAGPGARRRCGALPVDAAGASPVRSATRTVAVRLDAAETRALLQEVPAAYARRSTRCCCARWPRRCARGRGAAGARGARGSRPRRGDRPGVDLTRTVGWFTSCIRWCWSWTREPSLGERLQAVKEQLRAVPQHGLGYGVLRYLSADRGAAATACARSRRRRSSSTTSGSSTQERAVGVARPLWPRPRGPRRGARPTGRRYLLMVNGRDRAAAACRCGWTYSRGACTSARRSSGVADDFLAALRALIAHCRERRRRAATRRPTSRWRR